MTSHSSLSPLILLLCIISSASAAGYSSNKNTISRREKVAGRDTDDSSATAAYKTATSSASNTARASSTTTVLIIIGVVVLASALGAFGLYCIRRRQGQHCQGRYQAPLVEKLTAVSSPLSSAASLSSAFPSPLPPLPSLTMTREGSIERRTGVAMELQERKPDGEGGRVKFASSKDRIPTPWPFHRPFSSRSTYSAAPSPSPPSVSAHPSPAPGCLSVARKPVYAYRRTSIASSLHVIMDDTEPPSPSLPSPPLPQTHPSKARFDEAMERWKATSSLRRSRPIYASPTLGLETAKASSLLLPLASEPRQASLEGREEEDTFQARGIRLEDLEEAARLHKSLDGRANDGGATSERSRNFR